MTWGFLWLMVALKIPIAALLYIVWWAIKQSEEPELQPNDGDGGTKVRPPGHEPARGRFPRHRGPHGEPLVPPPPRVRTTLVRSRDPEHT